MIRETPQDGFGAEQLLKQNNPRKLMWKCERREADKRRAGIDDGRGESERTADYKNRPTGFPFVKSAQKFREQLGSQHLPRLMNGYQISARFDKARYKFAFSRLPFPGRQGGIAVPGFQRSDRSPFGKHRQIMISRFFPVGGFQFAYAN